MASRLDKLNYQAFVEDMLSILEETEFPRLVEALFEELEAPPSRKGFTSFMSNLQTNLEKAIKRTMKETFE